MKGGRRKTKVRKFWPRSPIEQVVQKKLPDEEKRLPNRQIMREALDDLEEDYNEPIPDE